jgi:hypothetical protein
MFMFAGDLAQTEGGSEGGFDLRPRFRRNLAAHVRLRLTAARSDCKAQRCRSGLAKRAAITGTDLNASDRSREQKIIDNKH